MRHYTKDDEKKKPLALLGPPEPEEMIEETPTINDGHPKLAAVDFDGAFINFMVSIDGMNSTFKFI